MCILLCLPLQGSAQQVDLSNESLYALISPSDLYCSFFIWEGEYPATRITGWENRESRVLLKDGDLVYLNKGSADGMERGQVYLILNIGPKIKKYGHLTFQTGRVRITQVTKDKAMAQLEHTCGIVKIGYYLVPFVEKEGRLGRDEGYDVPLNEENATLGHFLFLEDNLVQVGSNHRALIDLGSQDGLHISSQLLACRKTSKGAFLQAFANMVVIDVKKETATVKILSCKDAITMTDMVAIRPEGHPGTGSGESGGAF